MRKLTIDRSRWLRGEGSDISFLRRERDGKMCCLGFLALQCGMTVAKITGVANPSDVLDERWPLTIIGQDDHCIVENTNLTNNMIEMNDAEWLAEEEREESLKKLFAVVGIELEFVDG